MRLDKFLKVSRIIKRRTVANEACDGGRVLVNDKPAKASLNVKVGDVIEVQFGNRSVKAEVLKGGTAARHCAADSQNVLFGHRLRVCRIECYGICGRER